MAELSAQKHCGTIMAVKITWPPSGHLGEDESLEEVNLTFEVTFLLGAFANYNKASN